MIDTVTIFIPFVAFWFTNITGIPQKFRRAFQKDSFKPFDCSKCLAFWLALGWQLKLGFNWDSVVIVTMSSFIGYLLYAYSKKLNIPIND